MAAAGVPYAVGREPANQYGEPLGGFLPDRAYRRPGFRPNTLYPVKPVPDIAAGEGDRKVQAYNFRGVLDKGPDRLPFPKPDDYDPKLYTYLGQLLEQRQIPGLSSIVTRTALLPNNKYQTNQALFIGFDLPGASWDYPDGDWRFYATRSSPNTSAGTRACSTGSPTTRACRSPSGPTPANSACRRTNSSTALTAKGFRMLSTSARRGG